MPHVYDTGQLIPQRTAIRNAVAQRLLTLARPAMYLQHVALLPMRIDESEEGFKLLDDTLGGRAPALLVALGRGEVSPAGMPASRARKVIELFVYVVSSHARGKVAGRLAGDIATTDVTKDPGVEIMMEHVEELLIGRDLGIAGVEPIRPLSESEFYTGEAFTAWLMEFSVRVDRSINHNRLVTTLLTEIETRNNFADTDEANPVFATRTSLEEP